MKLETRAYDITPQINEAEPRTIVGLPAIPYDKLSKPLRNANGEVFYEIIKKGAATRSVAVFDILALNNHDTAQVLGRKSAGTLTLEDTELGVNVRINVPNTSYGDDLLELVKRGDVFSFSFGFSKPVARLYTDKATGNRIREISDMDLKEVSVVSMPAYNDTVLDLRSEDFADKTEEPAEAKATADTAKAQLEKRDGDIKLKFRLLSLTHK